MPIFEKKSEYNIDYVRKLLYLCNVKIKNNYPFHDVGNNRLYCMNNSKCEVLGKLAHEITSSKSHNSCRRSSKRSLAINLAYVLWHLYRDDKSCPTDSDIERIAEYFNK